VIASPVLRSPLGSVHVDLGANVVAEGGTEVVRSYGDLEKERDLLITSAAICDLTPRAKIDARGAILDQLLDQGLVARVTPRWALALGPPGPVADRVEALQRIAGDRAMVTDATHLYCGIALAGPALPELLARLTSWDPATLEAGAATGTPIADVRAVLLRRATSFPLIEAYVPTEFARYVWASVADVVRRLGGGPVGWDVLRTEGWS
jgi:glycine cleavage system aminomethyltransferase T